MDIVIRALDGRDLPEADRIFRMAFGTFLGMADPMSFMGDADLIGTRWRADPAATLGAYLDDTLVGSNFAANWGSFGTFGPLTVRPDLWNRGIAGRLLAATLPIFERWGTRQTALFTFPGSPKHVGLYQKFGFWPQHLIPVLSKAVQQTATAGASSSYAALPVQQRAACRLACRGLTESVYPGLDLGHEIETVAAQQLGDTVLIHDGAGLAAFAICHLGAGSEAGGGAAYIKFAAVRPGDDAARRFDQLLAACENLAHDRGLQQLVAGINTARHDAYRALLKHGFGTVFHGLCMQRHNNPGYNRPDCFVIDDWR